MLWQSVYACKPTEGKLHQVKNLSDLPAYLRRQQDGMRGRVKRSARCWVGQRGQRAPEGAHGGRAAAKRASSQRLNARLRNPG